MADFGHHRCVRILLKHGADIKAKDKSDGNNCLMKAIEKNHRYNVPGRSVVIVAVNCKHIMDALVLQVLVSCILLPCAIR